MLSFIFCDVAIFYDAKVGVKKTGCITELPPFQHHYQVMCARRDDRLLLRLEYSNLRIL